MANLTGKGSLKFVALRATRLDDAGAFVTGASSVLVTGDAIEMGYDPITETGAALRQRNGAGVLCLSYDENDKITGYNLTLNLCRLDAELFELLTGGSLVLEDGDVVGYEIPAPDATPQGVSIEGWAWAWDGNVRATKNGDAAFIRHIFPKTLWTPGRTTLNEGAHTFPLTGKASANAEFSPGPAADLPADAYEEAYGWYLDDSVPDATSGFAAWPLAS